MKQLSEAIVRCLPKQYLQDLLIAKRKEVKEAQLQEAELKQILVLCEKNLVKKKGRPREAEACLPLVRQEELRGARKRPRSPPRSPEIDTEG